MNIKEYILWLEDEVKELKGVVNNNNKLTLEQLTEVQYNLEDIQTNLTIRIGWEE